MAHDFLNKAFQGTRFSVVHVFTQRCLRGARKIVHQSLTQYLIDSGFQLLITVAKNSILDTDRSPGTARVYFRTLLS